MESKPHSLVSSHSTHLHFKYTPLGSLVISRHGALVRTAADLLPDSVIEVENPSNHRHGRFRVVWTLEKRALGKWDAGLESTEESEEIWGMDSSAAPA